MLTRPPSLFPPTTVDERRLDRRRFLGACGAAAALAVLGNRVGRAGEAGHGRRNRSSLFVR